MEEEAEEVSLAQLSYADLLEEQEARLETIVSIEEKLASDLTNPNPDERWRHRTWTKLHYVECELYAIEDELGRRERVEIARINADAQARREAMFVAAAQNSLTPKQYEKVLEKARAMFPDEDCWQGSEEHDED